MATQHNATNIRENGKDAKDIKVDAIDTTTDRVERDWFLQRLIAIVNGASANGAGINLPITILTGGATITGQLISNKVYFERFATIFGGTLRRAGDKEETATRVTKLFSDLGDMGAMRAKAGLPQPSEEPPPQFIHLANASIVDHTGVMPSPESQELSLWRGRISAVDAFMFGTMSTKRS